MAEAVVEADRALVLAAQGRLREAVVLADDVAGRLGAPAGDDRQQWANQQATVLLTTLARLLAEAGDPMTAERYLLEVAVPATQSRRSYATAQHQLACSVVWREEGDVERAEAPVLAAVEQFNALDTMPALAVARLAEARLADTRGHTVAARAVYDRAIDELGALGLRRESADAVDAAKPSAERLEPELTGRQIRRSSATVAVRDEQDTSTCGRGMVHDRHRPAGVDRHPLHELRQLLLPAPDLPVQEPGLPRP